MCKIVDMVSIAAEGKAIKALQKFQTNPIFFAFSFTIAKSMGLTLIAATAVAAVFALINFQMKMNALEAKKGGTVVAEEEEDI